MHHFVQPKQNTNKGQNESLLFHQTWHEQFHLDRYIALRQRIFQNRSRWRLTRTAPYQESHWWWRCCQVLLFSQNDVSSPLLVPLSTIHPQQMLTKTTIATGSSAPEICSIHHLDTYCVKSHSPLPSSIVHKNDIKIWTSLNILVISSWLSS